MEKSIGIGPFQFYLSLRRAGTRMYTPREPIEGSKKLELMDRLFCVEALPGNNKLLREKQLQQLAAFGRITSKPLDPHRLNRKGPLTRMLLRRIQRVFFVTQR